MEIIKRYETESEEIIIARYPNGKYYIHYGWNEKNGIGASVAGDFETFAEAEKMMKKHRPGAAEKVEHLKVCWRCLMAIEAHEGKQRTTEIFIDDDAEPDESKCDWCEETGNDKLYILD